MLPVYAFRWLQGFFQFASSTFYTFAYPFLPFLCMLLQSHDFHDKFTNTLKWAEVKKASPKKGSDLINGETNV